MPPSPITIDWQRSIVQTISVNGRQYFLKRDDLLTPISGNKARKLEGLLNQDLSKLQRIISYGGAQSNAMLALAQLARLLDVRFDYYTRPVPKWLKVSPNGNLKAALSHGMHWHISDSGRPEGDTLQGNPPHTQLIPQGIAMPEAAIGMRRLADEIQCFCELQNIEDLAIVLPSGTGATALHLQQYLSHTVYTVPCIGDHNTLTQLFKSLAPKIKRYPKILDSNTRYHFGEPHPELLTMYQQLLAQTGIEFELLYDAKTWLVLQEWACDKPILYLHNGGISGNASMLARYRRLGHTT